MKIAFLGDIALIGKYDITKNQDVNKRLKALSEKLKEYDYVVANLESPLTNRERTKVCKSMHLRTSTVNVQLLKYLNINAVSIANNHIYDYEVSGMQDTIKCLDDNGIEWFGANSKFITKEINGQKVCFSGFCCYSTNASGYIENNKNEGVNLLSYKNIMKQLDMDIKEQAMSVMSFHWGDEHTNYPKYEHICLARKIATIKDVIIVGHHPHIIQGLDRIKNSLVAYSLGNCLFDNCRSINGSFELVQNDNNKKSFILEVEIKNGKILKEKCCGFRDNEDAIDFIDIDREINKFSKALDEIKDIEQYENIRKDQINKVVIEKFGKRDLKWVLSRMNYYSIGAYITAKIRKQRYIKEVAEFLGENKL